MLQSPRQTKYRKVHKGRLSNSLSTSYVSFGEYGLQALEPGRITARQIEAARVAITRKIKKLGKLWVRIFPNVPVTKKPVEVRMGKGKGSVDHWICRVKTNKVLFEIGGIPADLVKAAFKSGAHKLPVKTRIITAVDKTTPVAGQPLILGNKLELSQKLKPLYKISNKLLDTPLMVNKVLLNQPSRSPDIDSLFSFVPLR